MEHAHPQEDRMNNCLVELGFISSLPNMIIVVIYGLIS
jgi:hypothetical protein